MSPLTDTKSVPVPESHRALFEGEFCAALITVMPGGQPQASVVWVDYDGTYILINTTLERQKGHNMLANPKETRVIVKIEPSKVSLDAIFKSG